MQDKIKLNSTEIFQPDSGSLDYDLETTYTSDSGRIQAGTAHLSPLFTVEALTYSASNVPVSRVTEILQIIGKGRPFTLHYYSVYYGAWRDARFYVGKNSCKIGYLTENEECIDTLSFKMVGVNPI